MNSSSAAMPSAPEPESIIAQPILYQAGGAILGVDILGPDIPVRLGCAFEILGREERLPLQKESEINVMG